MTQNVIDLQKFYETSLGKHCQSRIDDLVQEFWPDLKGLSVLAMGYPFPYISRYLEKSERLCVLMNAPQGAIHWPVGGKNLTALIDYDSIPLPDQSLDRIIMIHSLEYAQSPHAILREIWRVLKSTGRVLILTPNRRSIWAQIDDTPFGNGNPYTMTQLTRILNDHQFTILRSIRGLYIFPSQNEMIQSVFPLCDYVGPIIFKKFSGIVGIEASKELYSGLLLRERRVTQAAFARARAGG